jgi:polysaccharide pyruvyl transferase WcaK-like protein
MCYNRGINRNKGNEMTVKDLIAALAKMPPDASVCLMGSYETFDGYSHPYVELDADGEVIIREACEDEVTL